MSRGGCVGLVVLVVAGGAGAGCRTALEWEPDGGAVSSADLAVARVPDFSTAQPLDFAPSPDDCECPPDLAVADLPPPSDFAPAIDLVTPPPPPDLTSPPDLASPPPDLSTTPADLSTPRDLATPPDLAPPPPSCSDGIKDGRESDVDCGGGTCAPCGGGRHCQVKSDCASGTCTTGGLCRARLRFGAPAPVDVNGGPVALVAADLDGDGLADLATANFSNAFAAVILGRGNGSFRSTMLFGAGLPPLTIAAGDFNADGRLDLVLGDGQGAGVVDVLLGSGGGFFKAPSAYKVGVNPSSIATGDLDHDGRADVVVANRGVINGAPGNLAILIARPDGSFPPTPSTVQAGLYPDGVALADFNRDGKLDVAAANLVWNGAVQVLAGDGVGGFGSPVAQAANGNPYAVAAADLDENGRIDLVVANSGTGDVSVLLGNGDGSFAAHRDFACGKTPVGLAIADFDLDGAPDLVVVNALGMQPLTSLAVLLGNGDGSFAAPVTVGAGTGPGSVAVADFNRDGKPDLATTDTNGDAVVILLNTSF